MLPLGRDTPSNDKHTFQVTFTGCARESWQPMNFRILTSYGYYGSSSGYSSSSDDMGRYLAAAIGKHAAMLLDEAVMMAYADAETARQTAEAEARAVLEATV